MDNKIEDINFDEIDFLDYQEEIDDLNKRMNNFLNKRSIKRALKKYRIKDLEKENEKLKEKCEKQQYAITENCDLRLEIEQLKENNLAMQEEMCRTWEKLNIIKELRSWLEAIKTMYENEYKDVDVAEHYKSVLSKLNELTGEEK